jgi:hypothetical protein
MKSNRISLATSSWAYSSPPPPPNARLWHLCTPELPDPPAQIAHMKFDFFGQKLFRSLTDKGGKCHASARYIFTECASVTRSVFHPALLDYLKDDNDLIELEYYLPVLPTVLTNGAKGIGAREWRWPGRGNPLLNPRSID